MPVPGRPKIYHIVHVDRLASIIRDGFLWCDAEMQRRAQQGRSCGTTIGMNSIKQRRLALSLRSHPDLHVGDCVPFYFCPRSVMLYLIHQANHAELTYRGGQEPILHLEADLHATVAWAKSNGKRWAFTTSNAGSNYFEDYADLGDLDKIEWAAVQARNWQNCKEGKQAELLIEQQLPWPLVERIGVIAKSVYAKAVNALPAQGHRPRVEIRPDWYY